MDLQHLLAELHSVLDFQGVSDRAGLAVIPDVPADVTEFSAEHSEFTVPAVGTTIAGKRRQVGIKLKWLQKAPWFREPRAHQVSRASRTGNPCDASWEKPGFTCARIRRSPTLVRLRYAVKIF